MKTKLELAHEYAIEMAKQSAPLRSCIQLGWRYADEMYKQMQEREEAEAIKLAEESKKLIDDLKQSLNKPAKIVPCDDFEIDWRIAPDWANWWAVDKSCRAYWYAFRPEVNNIQNDFREYEGETNEAPSFNYKGDWRNSLRKRP